MDNPLQLEECIICFEETDNFMFFPCIHKVCPLCFPKLIRCPICQSNIITINQPQVREQTQSIIRDDVKIFCFVIIIIIFFIWVIYICKNYSLM
jgi:hypothetical protein